MTITVGKPAPAFELASSEGGTVKLADLAGAPAVLYFYPKDSSPGCTTEAEGFRDAMPALAKLGVKVFGISKDSIASHCRFRDKAGLTFPLLSDPDGAMIEAYDAWGDKTLYGVTKKGILRSTVLVDSIGKVVQHWPKVQMKTHVEDVLAAARALVGDAPATKPKPAATKPKPTPKKKKSK